MMPETLTQNTQDLKDVEQAADAAQAPASSPSMDVPVAPENMDEIVQALRAVDHLNGLGEQEYLWLAKNGCVRCAEAGALVFREGEVACHMSILMHGEVHVRRRNSGPIALFIGSAGQITGKLPFSRMKTWGGDGYTASRTWVLDIHEDLFPSMLAAIPSMAQRCVSILLDRVREVTRLEQQAEKLTALGKLAANLAHELNNPRLRSAAVRGAVIHGSSYLPRRELSARRAQCQCTRAAAHPAVV